MTWYLWLAVGLLVWCSVAVLVALLAARAIALVATAGYRSLEEPSPPLPGSGVAA